MIKITDTHFIIGIFFTIIIAILSLVLSYLSLLSLLVGLSIAIL
ncbi:putative sulfate exporter family transporter, partial [Staphylococcus pasteuri]